MASFTNFPHLRIDIPVTVAVDTDLGKARRVLLELVAEDDDLMADPAPRVIVRALNDYNVEIELQVWIEDERRHIAKRYALREAMFEALNAAGVVLPFETLEIRARVEE